MKHPYRPLINIFLLSTSLLFASCNKYLEENPENAITTEKSITDAGTARAAILGAYDALQGYYAGDFPTLGAITANNVTYNGSLSQYLQLDQNAIPSDNVITVDAYQKIYKAINSANSVIAYVPGVTDPTLGSDEKNKILGEAYFIRALGYFDLGRGWGGVQLQLKPTSDLSVLSGIKRSTLDETYAQVQTDLKQAESLLPEDATTRNRAQKSTARALRARLDLYRENWDSAEYYATQVINNTKYSLVKPYKLFFTSPFLSSESVFELTFTSNDQNGFWNLWYPVSLGGQYTLKPSDSFVTKINDPNIGGSRKSLIATSKTNEIYGALYNTSATSTDPAYIIRIAELYLIRAEARAKKAKPDLAGAISDLDLVRARADVPGTSATTQPEIIQAIEDENSIEFAFESHRWFDLARTKRTGTVLGITNSNYWLFPIPSSDILSDPDVTQNPGY